MFNFSFHNPTRIHFGSEKIAQIAREIPADARVLVIYGGGSIKSNGVYEQVKTALGERHWFEFGGVESNPQYDTLIQALDVIKAHNIDYLLAVGGGSVIDGSKFIAAASHYEGEDPWDIFTKHYRVKAALPLGVVLTLPATGSESNTVSVVSRGQDKLSFASSRVRPLFAVLDPAVGLSLSLRQVSNGVVDAFIHVIEQYLTYPVNAKVQDRFAEGLLLTLIEEGPKALDPKTCDDLDVRANIMWSASLALNGLIGVGVPQDWTTHMIGHEITAAYGVDHARTLSIILPAVMKHQRQNKAAKLKQYAERVWQVVDGSDEEKIDAAIAKTEAFFKRMQVPVRLSEANIGADAVDNILAQLESHGMLKLGENQTITLEKSREILTLAI
ncbi:iron-containing alcohol dehydrogenase [Eionea flava]